MALFDDDLEISTRDLNRLFRIGEACGLALWQAALSSRGYWTWRHLLQRADSIARIVPMVEIMMPVFSAEALRTCWPTFLENYSAWGLDSALWPSLLAGKPLAVVDAVTVRHNRPVRSASRVLPSGLTSQQELHLLLHKHGIRTVL